MEMAEVEMEVDVLTPEDDAASEGRALFHNDLETSPGLINETPVSGTVLHTLSALRSQSDATPETSARMLETTGLTPTLPSPTNRPSTTSSTILPNLSAVTRPSPLPTPAASQSDLLGMGMECLTEQDAETNLSSALKQLHRKCGDDLEDHKWKLVAVGSWPSSVGMAVAALFMAIVALVIGLQGDAAALCSVESALLFCLSMLHLMLHQYRAQLTRCDGLARVYTLLHAFIEEQSQQQSVQEVMDGLRVWSGAVTTVKVLRGVEGSKKQTWKTVMPALLVKGDLIELMANEAAPAPVSSIEPDLPTIELEMGKSWTSSTFQHNEPQSRYFRVEDCPSVLLDGHGVGGAACC